jgi:hypothetical protein
MGYPTEKELQAARERFQQLINQERAKVGLAPQTAAPAGKPVDSYMERWKTQGAGNATEAFIRMNAERVARGELPLGASGQPVGSSSSAVPVHLPEALPTSDEDDFFSDAGPKIAKSS